MKKKLSKILVGLLVVVCIVEGFFLYRAYVVPSSTLQTARKINRIEQIIDKYGDMQSEYYIYMTDCQVKCATSCRKT